MINVLPESNEFILGLEIRGKISLQEEQKYIKKIEDIILEYGEINILVVLDDNANWGVQAGIEDLKWLITHMKNINKIAIVSSSTVWKWLVTIDGFFAPLVGIGEKYFDIAKTEDAWTWINQN